MGEGSVLRAATISRFRFIWKGGKGQGRFQWGLPQPPRPHFSPLGCPGHPTRAGKKSGRAYDTLTLSHPDLRLPFNRGVIGPR